jgi:hypothetical protein
MSDVFNEEYLMNTYQTSMKGETEPQETEKLSPH